MEDQYLPIQLLSSLQNAEAEQRKNKKLYNLVLMSMLKKQVKNQYQTALGTSAPSLWLRIIYLVNWLATKTSEYNLSDYFSHNNTLVIY